MLIPDREEVAPRAPRVAHRFPPAVRRARAPVADGQDDGAAGGVEGVAHPLIVVARRRQGLCQKINRSHAHDSRTNHG